MYLSVRDGESEPKKEYVKARERKSLAFVPISVWVCVCERERERERERDITCSLSTVHTQAILAKDLFKKIIFLSVNKIGQVLPKKYCQDKSQEQISDFF